MITPEVAEQANSPRNPSASARPQDDTIVGLVSCLAEDMSTLLNTEVRLAKAEMREAAEDAKSAAVGMAGGAALALSGLVIVLLALAYALAAYVLPLWLSALIVGCLALGIGIALMKSAQGDMTAQSFSPTRTAQNLSKDAQHIKRSAT